MIVRTRGAARVVFTDRRGGVSAPPYESANLADHVGDDTPAVIRNRAHLADRAGLANPAQWVWLCQVHGDEVVVCHRPSGTEPGFRSGTEPVADAAVTAVPGLPLVILTADCAPLALIGDTGVAAVHAGWAGLELGVVERAADALRAVSPGPVHAILGPCIRPCCYEFGADLLARVADRFGDAVVARTTSGAPALDIPAAVRAALEHVGIDELDDVGVCNATSPDYFSYRRDGITGRQAMLVVLEP